MNDENSEGRNSFTLRGDTFTLTCENTTVAVVNLKMKQRKLTALSTFSTGPHTRLSAPTATQKCTWPPKEEWHAQGTMAAIPDSARDTDTKDNQDCQETFRKGTD